MSDHIIVYKDRTNVLPVSLGFDVSGDTITSEIRTPSGTLIATWVLVYDSDGSDGELILTLDNSVTSGVEYSQGLMDLKRVVNGEPVAVFESAVEVEFRETVTQ